MMMMMIRDRVMILSIKDVKGEEKNNQEESEVEIDKKSIINKKASFKNNRAVIDTNKSITIVVINKDKGIEIKYIQEIDNNFMIATIIETGIENIGNNTIKMREEAESLGGNIKEAKEIIKHKRIDIRETIDSNINYFKVTISSAYILNVINFLKV